MRVRLPRTTILRYGAAVLAVVLSLFFTLSTDFLIDRSSFALLFAAVIIAAWYGGWGPGLVSLTLSVVSGEYFIIPPRWDFEMSWDAAFPLFTFVPLSLVIIGLFSAFQQRESSLQQSEARYRTLFEYAPDGIVIADSESYYLDANAAMCQMFGYTRDEFIGLHASDIVSVEELPNIDTALRTIESRSEYNQEWQFRRKDGSVFPGEVIATAMPDGNLLGVVRDITERKQSGSIRESYSAIVEFSEDAIIGKDLTGIITSWNPAAEKMFGFTRQEMVGKSILTIIPADRVAEEPRILGGIARGEIVDHFETVRIAKDGTPVDVSLTVSPIKDTSGKIIGASKILRDITERKRIEDALGKSEERFRFLNDLAESIRGLTDPEQIMAVMARMLGEHLSASRCAYAAVENDSERFTILYDYTDGCESTVGDYKLSLFGSRAVTALRDGKILVVRNVDEELTPDDGADMFSSIGIKAIITCPLVKDGSLRAMMAVHQTTPRDWTPEEIAIVQEVVERCWATIERRKAEDALRSSEDQFRTMANSIPQLASMARIDGSVFWYNQRWYEYTGRNQEQMEDRGWQDVVAPGMLQKITAEWQTAIDAGEPFEMEFPIRRADGEFRAFLNRVQPLRNADGRIVNWFGTNTDVETLKQAEDGLRRSEEQLSGIISSAMDAIITIDSSEHIVLFNTAAETMFGCGVDDALGKPLDRFIPARFRQDHHSHIRAFGKTNVTNRAMAIFGLRCDGTEFPMEASISQLESAGEKFFTVILRDITDRKRAAQDIRDSERRFRALLEHSGDSISLINANNEILYLSPSVAAIEGYTPEELLGRTGLEHTHPDDIPVVKQAVSRLLADPGRPVPVLWRRKHKDGHWIWLEGVATNLLDDPAVGAIVTNYRDVTARLDAEEKIRQLNSTLENRVVERTAELQAANKELEAFSYSVSHDLRAPLRHINGFSMALLEDCADQLDETGKGYLQEVRNASREMAQLIDDVLQLARVARSEMNREKVDLSEMALDILDALQRRAPGRTVKVSVEDGVVGYGDRRLLHIVLTNLLSNAWKFTEKREDAVISFGRDPEDKGFFVSDNGAGFDMAYADKLFGAFQRLHSADEFEGTGIGLATVQRIVNRHGGRIWAEGAVNKGATFHFMLPDLKEFKNEE